MPPSEAKLGCFFGACCLGTVTDHPLGLSFPAYRRRARSSLIGAVLALYVHARKRFDGQVTPAFLGYAVLRFLVEVVGDADRGRCSDGPRRS